MERWRTAIRLPTAPRPGLDTRLHPAGAAGGNQPSLLRRADPSLGRRRMRWARELVAKEGIFTRVSVRAIFRRRCLSFTLI
jgi:hypothetical protein